MLVYDEAFAIHFKKKCPEVRNSIKSTITSFLLPKFADLFACLRTSFNFYFQTSYFFPFSLRPHKHQFKPDNYLCLCPWC